MSSLLVDLHTSLGKIRLSLNEQAAPKTVENFLTYVRNKHYDKTIFHRVIPGFMIQGGGFIANMQQKDTGAPIANEANNKLKNSKYTVAMARTNDPHSAGAQFFINVNDNDFLNFSAPTPQGWGYAVFGEVTQGQDVVDRIVQVKTGNRGFHQDVPVEPIVIERADLVVLETIDNSSAGSLESVLGDLDVTKSYPRGQTPVFQVADEPGFIPLTEGSDEKKRFDTARSLAVQTIPVDQQQEVQAGYSWTLQVSVQKGVDGQLHVSRLDVAPETEAEAARRNGVEKTAATQSKLEDL